MTSPASVILSGAKNLNSSPALGRSSQTDPLPVSGVYCLIDIVYDIIPCQGKNEGGQLAPLTRALSPLGRGNLRVRMSNPGH